MQTGAPAASALFLLAAAGTQFWGWYDASRAAITAAEVAAARAEASRDLWRAEALGHTALPQDCPVCPAESGGGDWKFPFVAGLLLGFVAPCLLVLHRSVRGPAVYVQTNHHPAGGAAPGVWRRTAIGGLQQKFLCCFMCHTFSTI